MAGPSSAKHPRFSDTVETRTFEPEYPPRKRRKRFPTPMSQILSNFSGAAVTDAMLTEAAKLFSENYGIWGNKGPGKPGSRVRMNASRLRAQSLPEGARNFYAMVTVNGALAGNAFASRWDHGGRQICWVTQLVVHRDFRERSLATLLLSSLLSNEADDALGIMSSHPAACRALAKAADVRFPDVSLDFARDHGAGVIASAPVGYIRDAKVCGSLFDPNDTTGMVSGADSDFYVDHAEPLEALAWFKEDGNWPLGDLPDGHEFLFLVERARRRRSRSASSGRGQSNK